MDHAELFDRSTKNQDGITGVRIGVVTNNEDPKDLGRVKLRFPWREADDESYWARITTLMSGDKCGTYFLPEVDDEVLVAFAGGDVHQPFVLGSLWNGKHKPPEKNNEGHNDLRTLVSRQGHTIQFDDNKKKGGSLSIETNQGHKVRLDDTSGSEKLEIIDKSGDNSIRLDTKAGTVSVEADQTLEFSATDVKIRADKTVDISAKQSLDLEGKGGATLSSNGKMDISSKMPLNIKSSAILNVKGKMVFIN